MKRPGRDEGAEFRAVLARYASLVVRLLNDPHLLQTLGPERGALVVRRLQRLTALAKELSSLAPAQARPPDAVSRLWPVAPTGGRRARRPGHGPRPRA
ncbi:MAG: hypothetical protein AB1609_17960, partial [Bacillota bacterium]